MTVYAITDTKKEEQGLRLLIFKVQTTLVIHIHTYIHILFAIKSVKPKNRPGRDI